MLADIAVTCAGCNCDLITPLCEASEFKNGPDTIEHEAPVSTKAGTRWVPSDICKKDDLSRGADTDFELILNFDVGGGNCSIWLDVIKGVSCFMAPGVAVFAE